MIMSLNSISRYVFVMETVWDFYGCEFDKDTLCFVGM
jgi:hypothetical protein